jgi:rfaE bifunctional protein kinase chain/domain
MALVSREQLAGFLDAFRKARIAVVGDFFLDRYLSIDPALAEPSVETGLITHQVVEIRNSPGAAGTVVNNLVALQGGEGRLFAVGVIGDDAYGFELRRELHRRGVDTARLMGDAERFTPTYTKPMIREHGGEREMERIDVINRSPTPARLEDAIIDHLAEIAPDVDAVILLDQVNAANCGVLTQRVRDAAATIAKKNPKTIFYADSRQFIGEFKNVWIKANHHEAFRTLGMSDKEPVDPADVEKAGKLLMERTGKPVYVTRGSAGILATTSEGQQLVPAVKVDGPVDIVGAGDSASAGIVLTLCAGGDAAQAAFVGNLVASITIQQLGTTGTASPQQVLKRWEQAVG